MDPLSDVLALLKPQSYSAGAFDVAGGLSLRFPHHAGIKCYVILEGDCFLTVDGSPTVHLTAGDCFLLPRGLPFVLTTDQSLTPIDFYTARDTGLLCAPRDPAQPPSMAGGHFALTGPHARMLLDSLPPVVHIRREEDKAAMRWSIDRMREEISQPQPGGSLIAQQLAYLMLVQALRLHLAENPGTGWLQALADRTLSPAIAAMHDAPGHPWTLQALAERVGMSRSVFAERFRLTVGATPVEYLTRWRMVLAGERLRSTADSISTIANTLGYDSESAFGKAFRRVMGSSPRQYSRGTS